MAIGSVVCSEGLFPDKSSLPLSLPLARARDILAFTLKQVPEHPDLWLATLRNQTDF
jgi:hypothetical protein